MRQLTALARHCQFCVWLTVLHTEDADLVEFFGQLSQLNAASVLVLQVGCVCVFVCVRT